jgi:lipopolysaccharide transport system permease protein
MSSIESRAIRISPAKSLALPNLRELWAWRELALFLAWRDIRVRYKQATLGIAWAIVSPLALMAVFTLFFGVIFSTPSEDVPRPVFIFAGVLTWLLFSEVFSSASASLLKDRHIFEKLYFPRLLVPLSSAASGLTDFGFGLVALLVMMAIYRVPLFGSIVLVVAFGLLAVFLALSAGIWFSALNLQFTDFRHITPLFIQLWFFATPIFYPASLIPEAWQSLYRLNPMVGVVESVRWAIFHGQPPEFGPLLLSMVPFALIMAGGLLYFGYFESTFAENL